MKDFKISAFLLLPYLTICGTLYHVAYWGKFDLNGLILINASDIIKYSTIPILPSFFLAGLSIVVSQYIFASESLYPPPDEGEKPRIEKYKHHKLVKTALLILWITASVSLYYKDINIFRWNSWALVTSLPIPVFLNNSGFLRSQIPDYKARMVAITLIVLLPLLAFGRGKEDSEYIYKNVKYQYTLPENSKYDTLKYLGMTQEKVVFTDMKNSQIILLDASVDTLVLHKRDTRATF